jgi:hypothetical protein
LQQAFPGSGSTSPEGDKDNQLNLFTI